MDNLGTVWSLGICTAGKHFQLQVIKMTESHSAYTELYPVIFSKEKSLSEVIGVFRLRTGLRICPSSKDGGINV